MCVLSSSGSNDDLKLDMSTVAFIVKSMVRPAQKNANGEISITPR